MSSTILRFLRDAKLNDGTLLRLSTLNEEKEIEISVSKAGVLSNIRLPNSTESAFELLQMSYKLLHSNLQKDLGRVVVETIPYDGEKEKFRYDSEDLECVNMHLNDLKVPTHDDAGNKYSTVGRINQLMKIQQQDLQK